MKIIEYLKLFNYLLLEENPNPVGVCRTIQEIRKLPRELKIAVLDILEGKIPEIGYHDVTLESLIENDKMKPVRAILMLDWIRREPAVAMRYMELEYDRAPQEVSDSDREMLQKVLSNLKSQHTVVEDNKEDIVIEED